MATFILDTDIISYLWDTKSSHHNQIVNKLNSLYDDDIVSISIISIYELTYGMNSFKDEKLKAIFSNALNSIKYDQDIHIHTLDVKSANNFSKLKLIYKDDTGINTISAKKNDLDFMIASIAMSQDAVLISNDKLFYRLANITSDLKVENWLD